MAQKQPKKSTPAVPQKFCLKPPSPGALIRHLMLSWLLAAFWEYVILPESLLGMTHLNGLAAMSLPRLLILTGCFTLLLWLFSCRFEFTFWERLSIPCIFLLLSAAALYDLTHDIFLLFCGLILIAMVVYAIWGHKTTPEKPLPGKKAHWLYPIIVGIFALAFTAILSYWSVMRIRGFSAPSFDFGLFAQMFHNMKETGLPTTTVERGYALSHFAVHVSPIYYLMLPFYCLFPYAETLQILQAVILASAVIPMWLICKHHGMHPLLRTLMCMILLLYPATAGGAGGYDLHENCFLLPLVLWLMYAIDRESIWLAAVMALLTLCVKEDAAVYVAVAALYLIIRTAINYRKSSKKTLIMGIGMFLLAILWFLLVTNYLNTKGTGVMSYRYSNLDYDNSGSLITVIKAAFLSPMKVLFECVDQEKLEFIGQTLLLLLGLPLITRKFERYILLIPYILVNLISDYQYQHNIFFQYTFGSTAFLLYLTAVNLADIKWRIPRLIASVLVAILSLNGFCLLIVPNVHESKKNYKNYQSYYDGLAQSLDLIPEGASVAAHGMYVTYLYDREVLFDLHHYCHEEDVLSCEFVVVRSNCSGKFYNGDFHGKSDVMTLLKENGYTLFHKNGSLEIYQKTP